MFSQLARDVMTRNVETVGDDWSLEQLARFLVDHSITGAPVTTREGKLVGVVSFTDLARAQSEREAPAPEQHDFFARSFEESISPDEFVDVHLVRESSRRVRDVMTKAIFDVEDSTPVAAVAEMMTRGRIHRVFVRRGKELVGVISALDLLRLMCD